MVVSRTDSRLTGDITRRFQGTTEEDERKRRITRRGITFGTRVAHPSTFQALDQLPSKGGRPALHVLSGEYSAPVCIHAARLVQYPWVRAPNTRLDSVVGQPPTPKAVEQSWSTEYGQAPTTKFRFENFVRMKGGEYFFAPSLRFFAAL
jgi:hypothetical protein